VEKRLYLSSLLMGLRVVLALSKLGQRLTSENKATDENNHAGGPRARQCNNNKNEAPVDFPGKVIYCPSLIGVAT
jgi:hypothetical protein